MELENQPLTSAQSTTTSTFVPTKHEKSSASRVLLLFIIGFLLFTILATICYGIAFTYLFRREQEKLLLHFVDTPYILDIIAYNDVYEITGVPGAGNLPINVRGGASRVSRYIKDTRLKKSYPNQMLVISAGDMISPSILSTLFKGAQMIDVNNHLGLNFSALGNHEFDFGLSVLEDRIKQSQFKWINSNLMDSSTGKPLLNTLPYTTFTMPGGNKAKVGFFGITFNLLNTIMNSTGITVKDPMDVAREQIKYLKQIENCNYIIAITHQNVADDCLMTRLPDLDLILGGHDHLSMLNSQCGPAVYVKATQDWINIWHLRINFNQTVPAIEYRNVPITTAMQTDPEMDDIIAYYETLKNKEFSKVIGKTMVPLNAISRDLRSEESNLADFCCDTIRSALRSDLVLLNGGGIRSNRLYPAGDINLGNVWEWFPFNPMACVVKINGSTLHEALERGVANVEGLAGSFPQISGFKYEFNIANMPGNRITRMRFLNDTDIDLNSDVLMTLGLPDFLCLGNDGYTMMPQLPVVTSIDKGISIVKIVTDAIQQLQTISPGIDSRIVKRIVNRNRHYYEKQNNNDEL